MSFGTMHGLLHKSLADAPEIILTVVSAFSVGFLLWFLVGLLRELRRMRTRQVLSFRFTGERVWKFWHRDRKGAPAAQAGKVQVFSVPDLRSPQDAVKMRWLILGEPRGKHSRVEP